MRRLSEDLTHYEPGRCARCGAIDPQAGTRLPAHVVWRECDGLDRPEARYVELCRPCGDKIVEPHPRLYIPLEPHTPAPGAMPICRDCSHRVKSRCACPQAQRNGGEGIEIVGPKPSRVHVFRRGKSAGRSGWIDVYLGPSKFCTGKSGEPLSGETTDVESNDALV